MRRPIVPIAVAFLAGTVLAHYWQAPLWAVITSSALFAVAAMSLFIVKLQRPAYLLLLCLIASLGVLDPAVRENAAKGDDARSVALENGGLARLRGVVAEAPGHGEKLIFNDAPKYEPYGDSGRENARARSLSFTVGDARVECDGREIALAGKVRVYVYRSPYDVSDAGWRFAERLLPGAAVDLVGRLSNPIAPSNPGQFDYARYLRASGVNTMMFVKKLDEANIEDPLSFNLPWHIGRVKGTISRAYYRNFSRDNAAFMAALLLGERQNLPDTLMDDMSTSGTAHFIAISGLNLAIIAAFGYFMLRMMMIPYRAQRALLIAGIILYSVMVGLSPPVFRAMVMIVLMLLAQLLGRRGETLNILALAAIVIAVVRPDDVMSVGYQLSFIAVFCLVVFTNPIVQFLRTLPARVAYRFSSDRHEIGFPQYLHIRTLVLGASSWRRRMAAGLWEGAALAVATTVAAWVGTFPLVLFHFGKFSIWTAAANLVMLPVMNLWMLIGFLVLIATLIQSAFGWAFLLVPAFIGHARAIAMIEWPAHFFSSLPMSFKNIPRVPIAAILVLYSAIASLLLWKRLQWTRYMTAGVLGVAVIAALWPVALQAKEGPFELTVLDVGHGGATFIRFPDGRTVLYDCGSYKQSDVARHVILPFLRERGVTHLDAVIISHPHLDHFDGLASLLENYRVGALVLTDYFTPGVNTYWAPAWEAIEESGVRVVRMRDGGRLEGFPELSFILARVSLPDKDLPEYTPMLNETSLVVRVECGGGSALLTGDMERQGIEWFNAHYEGGPVDVMVAPHHGDYEARLTFAMLQKLRPRAVIIPADRPLPRRELQSAVRRLSSKGRASEHAPDARLYTTRASGAIIVRIEGGQIYIKETLERHDE